MPSVSPPLLAAALWVGLREKVPLTHLRTKMGIRDKYIMGLLAWEVMRGTDATRKYWCIHKIFARLPRELAEQFWPEPTRLRMRPTRDDQVEELGEAAGEPLERMGDAGA